MNLRVEDRNNVELFSYESEFLPDVNDIIIEEIDNRKAEYKVKRRLFVKDGNGDIDVVLIVIDMKARRNAGIY